MAFFGEPSTTLSGIGKISQRIALRIIETHYLQLLNTSDVRFWNTTASPCALPFLIFIAQLNRPPPAGGRSPHQRYLPPAPGPPLIPPVFAADVAGDVFHIWIVKRLHHNFVVRAKHFEHGIDRSICSACAAQPTTSNKAVEAKSCISYCYHSLKLHCERYSTL